MPPRRPATKARAKSAPKAKAPAPKRAAPAKKPAPADPFAALRATSPDPAAVHAHFEALRDAEIDPARLFALAVDEARALDELCARTAPAAEFAGALAAALSRVLEGPAEGSTPEGLSWSLERFESLLRGAGARALDPVSHARALMALSRGHALAEDLPAAQKAAARAVKQSRAAFEQDAGLWAAYERALSLAWDVSAQARDAKSMAAWARARADAEGARPGGPDPVALCEALAPLWQLWAELGDAAKSLEAANEWLAAEERAGGRRGGGGRLDALRARAAAARAVLAGARAREAPSALEAFARAARAWVEGARAEVLRVLTPGGGASDEAPFALARLAEALSAQTEAAAMEGDAEGAIARAREWLAAERAVAGGALSEGCLAALSALAALGEQAGPAARAGAAEAVLLALEGAGPEADEARARALSDSARAHFALGRYGVAARRARAWLAGSAAGTGAAEAVTMRVLLARSEEAAGIAGAADGARAGKARATSTSTSTSSTGAGARKPSAALEAVELAARARAAWRSGDARAAAKRADEALEKLRGARGVPAAARDYVHYVHECARPGGSAKPSGGAECAARALAALESGDAARAAMLLRALRAEKLGDDGCTLAHVLAACVAWVERVAPGDPALSAGREALSALGEYGVLGPPAQPSMMRTQ